MGLGVGRYGLQCIQAVVFDPDAQGLGGGTFFGIRGGDSDRKAFVALEVDQFGTGDRNGAVLRMNAKGTGDILRYNGIRYSRSLGV